MIAVAIVGILAAVAIPAFTNYALRSKTSEATGNLKYLFGTASSYYEQDHWPSGLPRSGLLAANTNCVVDPAEPTSYAADGTKHRVDWAAESDSYEALNFHVADLIWYEYHIVVEEGRCRVSASSTRVYSFRAIGDLDGDTDTSLFEISVGSNEDNQLYRSPGIYEADPLE